MRGLGSARGRSPEASRRAWHRLRCARGRRRPRPRRPRPRPDRGAHPRGSRQSGRRVVPASGRRRPRSPGRDGDALDRQAGRSRARRGALAVPRGAGAAPSEDRRSAREDRAGGGAHAGAAGLRGVRDGAGDARDGGQAGRPRPRVRWQGQAHAATARGRRQGRARRGSDVRADRDAQQDGAVPGRPRRRGRRVARPAGRQAPGRARRPRPRAGRRAVQDREPARRVLHAGREEALHGRQALHLPGREHAADHRVVPPALDQGRAQGQFLRRGQAQGEPDAGRREVSPGPAPHGRARRWDVLERRIPDPPQGDREVPLRRDRHGRRRGASGQRPAHGGHRR